MKTYEWWTVVLAWVAVLLVALGLIPQAFGASSLVMPDKSIAVIMTVEEGRALVETITELEEENNRLRRALRIELTKRCT